MFQKYTCQKIVVISIFVGLLIIIVALAPLFILVAVMFSIMKLGLFYMKKKYYLLIMNIITIAHTNTTTSTEILA